SILFAKVVDGELLLLVHPSGHGDQQELEWVEDYLRLQNPLSRAQSRNASGQALSIRSEFWTLRNLRDQKGKVVLVDIWLRRLARLFGNALSPTFGLFADKQPFFLAIPRQCEFSGIQNGRLADQDFHHLDIFINLADQKRQFA